MVTRTSAALLVLCALSWALAGILWLALAVEWATGADAAYVPAVLLGAAAAGWIWAVELPGWRDEMKVDEGDRFGAALRRNPKGRKVK